MKSESLITRLHDRVDEYMHSRPNVDFTQYVLRLHPHLHDALLETIANDSKRANDVITLNGLPVVRGHEGHYRSGFQFVLRDSVSWHPQARGSTDIADPG